MVVSTDSDTAKNNQQSNKMNGASDGTTTFSLDDENDGRAPSPPLVDQPFRKRRVSEAIRPIAVPVAPGFKPDTVRNNIIKTLHSLGAEVDESLETGKLIDVGLDQIAAFWRRRDNKSEIAFQGLLSILEYCLQHSFDSHEFFEKFVNALGYNTVQFWRASVPYIYDSDMSFGTKFRDSLLFALTLYDVNTGKNRLRELYAAVPGLRKSLLGVHAKRFSEQFHHLQRRRSQQSLRGSEEHLSDIPGSDDESGKKPRSNKASMCCSDSDSPNDDQNHTTRSFANTHFQQRVINVSNAPPVSLTREKSGEWEIKQGSGGLVSCVDPIMSANEENIWLANLGMNLQQEKRKMRDLLNVSDDTVPLAPTTNTLGLPLIRQNMAEVLFHVIADEEKEEDESTDKKNIREEMSLLGVLNNYNKGSYKLNPVVVEEGDYNVYYGGISNGLLWPALHNLPEYIVSDYDDPKTLVDHWCSYVRVNYQFALDAVRNSRPQDFIWIHDYHLMLTGMIMQSLDQNLEIGFFLHIPFLPPDNFFTKYRICAFPILRGLLRFTKVGFQTHRDRAMFIELVEKHFPSAKIAYDGNLDINTVTFQGWSCSLGVFPVSIKNEDFLKIARDPECVNKSHEIRKKFLGENPDPEMRLLFSVERFDYTKGIREKLLAYRHYFKKYPDRIGKDVLFQVAVTNRRSVDTYRKYQDECIELSDTINKEFESDKYPGWKPLYFQTSGLQRADLIAHYLAMDIGVVTPKKDGMNLVAKEMLVCNPSAGLVLSIGAGSEIQFTMAGLHPDDGEHTYHRVKDVYDVDDYCDAFYRAATEPEDIRAKHGKKLHEFIMANDIERWSAAFLDPGWSHLVIHQQDIKTLDDFYTMMMRTRDVRRQIVERVLKGIPIRPHFGISLSNAKESLLQACESNSTVLRVMTSGDPDAAVPHASFDIRTELDEFEKDLNFLKYVTSDDVYNVESFIETLQVYHPVSKDKYREEVMALGDLFTDADHFNYFFTDRDGTLKLYSCSYPASVQPAYSGVIQAQFARRCAQTCAILTTAPMMQIGILDVSTIPEGYYYYGASAGREWFIDPSSKFKDQSIPEQDLELLDRVFLAISLLLEDPKLKHFAWIGSGLQKHYGHLTIARQDANRSIPDSQTQALVSKVHQIVKEIDPTGQTLSIIESETDMKIYLKERDSGEIFDKGQGIELLVNHMKCDLSTGTILVCGDSETDLPMLKVCLKNNATGVFTVWVTTNEELRNTVRKLCEEYNNRNYVFVSCPEVLLGGMAQATIREISIGRPAIQKIVNEYVSKGPAYY
uniref:Trehalose-6-phosphate phosphatase helical bundle domain-containing protein n=1 Tax=Panagrolaimus sp. PS1159 TaxID=55785 RepID=A0AC35FDQ1_9BILA